MKRPPRRQSRLLKVSELKHLESFLSDDTKSLVDRFAAGAMLFAVYSRIGDLSSVDSVSLDVCRLDGVSRGYLEARSLSHENFFLRTGLEFTAGGTHRWSWQSTVGLGLLASGD